MFYYDEELEPKEEQELKDPDELIFSGGHWFYVGDL